MPFTHVRQNMQVLACPCKGYTYSIRHAEIASRRRTADHSLATPLQDVLAADAIILGAPGRQGGMCGEMRMFLDKFAELQNSKQLKASLLCMHPWRVVTATHCAACTKPKNQLHAVWLCIFESKVVQGFSSCRERWAVPSLLWVGNGAVMVATKPSCNPSIPRSCSMEWYLPSGPLESCTASASHVESNLVGETTRQQCSIGNA